ncbi:anthranilate synthase component I family protein [Mucilaginibacter rubeus]|uniref:Anthranilate synthase component 1 n=1 Tax=Mucilaginibacter rubeus TaxID=2027860 RepID=A0AAE6JMQ2_9SPHI|nr:MULTISPECIES: anthranilate synthase component I family protein [Mucilaginibacter]QEM07457.1 anthranilate synthase component I family protein [Mucilaginibacter rubeus]QEM19910.1 anthranilate synthase component I family protein [Mucilaginibacter gossypii]QTE43383.1 anthranilate synthase component I family protein [Mucilaginibacter rubeus]QTE49983.1 anthranilate synthase component I family protein [Mucilaginibacter rubeus]QTE55074.1 anthranilate synthase component I family protein [Mucilaginib
MSTFKITTTYKKLLADTTTPVSIYLRLRDVFPNSLLLESSDYHSRENSTSYICCEPLSGIVLNNGTLKKQYPDGSQEVHEAGTFDLIEQLNNFTGSFETDSLPLKMITNGLFGYFTHEAVEHYETIKLKQSDDATRQIPVMQYHIYRYIIAIDHFKNELYIFHNQPEGAPTNGGIEKLEYLIKNKNFPEYSFKSNGDEKSNLTGDEFIAIVEKMKQHIYRGDVFQIVPSRAFSRTFLGDEFNVYRALRSINPSPYLFYFDFGDFRIFGSSPEAQITIKNNVANIFPIAGTFKRSGDDERDAELARNLENDPKESAEHVMLVDLARNDLSRHCENVTVKAFKEVQYYSHLIHLVSHVSGKLKPGVSAFKVVADTYPAGTLSGAPKYRAMEIIDENENIKRSFYSGAIGFLGFNGDFNHAIMIRSFLSKNNTLHYQAGAGIVAGSIPESELREVDTKISALRRAFELAEEL